MLYKLFLRQEVKEARTRKVSRYGVLFCVSVAPYLYTDGSSKDGKLYDNDIPCMTGTPYNQCAKFNLFVP